MLVKKDLEALTCSQFRMNDNIQNWRTAEGMLGKDDYVFPISADQKHAETEMRLLAHWVINSHSRIWFLAMSHSVYSLG